MNQSSLPLILGLCTAGFVSGFIGKRLAAGPNHPSPAAAVVKQDPGREKTRVPETGSTATASKSTKAITPAASSLHSTDTLETLAALDADSLYARLALWLTDASEPEVAAYWATVKDKKDRKNDITDLIFVNWTRLDPHAAIAAVAGSSAEHYAWWAWACHDPSGSFAAALAANPDRMNNVAWGLGEFHGDWMMDHFDQIPEAARYNAIAGLTKWDDCPDPLKILEFLKKTGNGFNQGIFNSLIRKDPWAAYDWIQNNQATISSRYGSRNEAMDALVKSMGETQPDALQRLADQTPSGDAKRKMEAALFDNLLKTDPDAAIEQAKTTQAPRIAAERLAAVGKSLLKSDPEKAFEMASSLFSVYPDALNPISWIRYPNGGSGSGEQIAGVDELVGTLLAKDPARLMTTQAPASKGFNTLTSKWAGQDLVGYTNWVNQQTDPAIRDQAAGTVVNQLLQDRQFNEAADWTMSSDKTKQGHLTSLLYTWKRSDPEEARAWLESANIPDEEKNQLLRSIGFTKPENSNDNILDQ